MADRLEIAMKTVRRLVAQEALRVNRARKSLPVLRAHVAGWSVSWPLVAAVAAAVLLGWMAGARWRAEGALRVDPSPPRDRRPFPSDPGGWSSATPRSAAVPGTVR